jgi:hypothetical protein
MSDDQQAETPKRGRPKGRKPKPPPVHRGPHHDDGHGDRLENFEYTPYEATNPLSIDSDIVHGIERDWGFSLLWVCYECNGKPFPDLVSARMRNGYAEIRKGNFGGALDFMCNKDGRIQKEGLVLMARPVEIERKAKAYEARMARDAVEQMKRSHRDEGVSGISMPGGNDPAARSRNIHRQTFEPGPKIPE